MSCHLVIKTVQPPAEFPVDVESSATIEELKEQVAGQVNLPKENIRLVCAGKIWQDNQTVASYEPKDGAIVHCLNNPPRVTPGSAEQTLSAPNPMAALMGGSGGGSALNNVNSGDPMQQMMAQSQQMLAQNPEMMQQLMNSPMVQQMMSNPETIRAMMRMNPQLNQLIEQRPEIGRLLDDPEILQQSMRMMANPSLMREMTRNQDRAIGQLNAIPGGMNALARAHEEIADPLFEAFSGGGGNNTPGEINSYSQSTEGAPNTEALPNPWGPPPSQAPTPAPAPVLGGTATTAPPSNPLAPNPLAPNPLAAMMMQPPAPMGQMGQQPGAAPGANPMQTMMQQMMQNPAMMQQSMQMAQQMFGGQGGGMGMGMGMPGMGAPTPMTGTDTTAPTPQVPTTPTSPAVPSPTAAPNPLANPMFGAMMQPPAGGFAGGNSPNPMAAMMQQMMSDPQMMQQSMAMRQAMMNNQNFGGGGYGFQPPVAPSPTPVPLPGVSPTLGATPPMNDQMQRIRFASQLAQLSAMGFSNEAACLRALTQHNGRVDAAIDTLLSSGEGSS